jgi:hypothetical protein
LFEHLVNAPPQVLETVACHSANLPPKPIS